MSSRKVERLVNLVVMLLEARRPISAEEIRTTIPGYGQSNLETFKRMFERDKEELREEGIPIEYTPPDEFSDEEGYRILKERYYLPELDLTDQEATALRLAAGLLRIRDTSTTRSALMKLAGDVPDAAAPKWISADLGMAVPNLPRTFEAVSDRKTVLFAYRKNDPTDRVLDPYGLVNRKGIWYLIGREHAHDEMRSFRLDRIVGELRYREPSRPSPEFDVPQGFKPEAVLESPPFIQGDIAALEAEVVFDASTAWLVERTTPWLALDWQEDGTAKAGVHVTDVAGFLSWLLWFDSGAELLGPPELVSAFADRLESIIG